MAEVGSVADKLTRQSTDRDCRGVPQAATASVNRSDNFSVYKKFYGLMKGAWHELRYLTRYMVAGNRIMRPLQILFEKVPLLSITKIGRRITFELRDLGISLVHNGAL